MMMLPLIFSVAARVAGTHDGASGAGAGETAHCRFCGGVIGTEPAGLSGDPDEVPSCALCHLVRHLDRPRIDDEALLIWLPEMSQPVLNCLVREMHCRLRALGETLHVEVSPLLDTEDRPVLWHAQQALLGRSEVAATRLGSAGPGDPADALVRLSPSAYGVRWRNLGGVRLLPRGRFFAGESDIYPEIVDGWRKAAASAVPRLSASDRGNG